MLHVNKGWKMFSKFILVSMEIIESKEFNVVTLIDNTEVHVVIIESNYHIFLEFITIDVFFSSRPIMA